MNWEQVWERAVAKVALMAGRIGERSPHAAKDGRYDDREHDWWTSGFWPGMLWLMYDRTGDDKFHAAAWSWDEKLERCFLRENRLHHDVGFQFLPAAVAKYLLTGDADGKRRGLAAANFLAGRYNPAGRFIRAWNGDMIGWAIVDCTMNLSLLLWAAEQSGDPRFRHVALAHADTVLEHFLRADGSARHIVCFDPETGAYSETRGGQGYSPDSAWSRGQAWALHGLAVVYRYSRQDRYLQGAKRVAHYFLAALGGDAVPAWDFRAPNQGLSGEPKDTSAGSIAASGLLELAQLVGPAEAGLYRESAERIMTALTERYASFGDDRDNILSEGTGNKPKNENVNVGLIYGDYYYVEALAKLCGWQKRFF
ncbi:glycoside hydrolase family 88 protein [Gordoniibacillus kamchatkensis]|nr:glycoside hydrolase family 88 protein [Paenibacillus sp. VKM B-2647]